MKITLQITLTLVCIVLFAFSPNKKPSLKTAMNALDDFCSFVPSGSTTILDQEVSIQAFYMSSTEITNGQYTEFLSDLKRKGENAKFEIAKIDSTKWSTTFPNSFLYPMETQYANHPAYASYPVVNVTRKGASLFCEWLTAKYDSMSNGELKILFRIPTRTEWIYAANGGNENITYAWGSPFLQNVKGDAQANFTQLGSENISLNQETGTYEIVPIQHLSSMRDGAMLTAQAKSYSPNPFGLYNMNGNVSEMISDGDFAVGGDWKSPGYDVRNESIKIFKETQPTVGFRVVASYLNP